MFRFIGLSSKEPVYLKSTLKKNFSISNENNEFPSSGWGIGFYHRSVAYLVKKASSIIIDKRLEKLSERISTNTLLIHFRNATMGEVKESNTQPFRYGNGCLRTREQYKISEE